MGTQYTHYRASINLAKIESWEVEGIAFFLKEEESDELSFEISKNFMTFEFVDGGDGSLYWSEDFHSICQEGEAECLNDILYNLFAKRALSLTYLFEWNSGGGWDEEEILPDFERLCEQMPTLILQEVLAKRLEMSV